MLNRLTHTNKLSQLIITAGLCLATVLAIQIDRPTTIATEKNLNGNGLMPNGISLNGTSFNGANLNGANLNGANLNGIGLSANGIHFKKLGLTSPTLVNASLNQKPISKIYLEGGQLALKIKRSD
jgi:uncharacterized protein YjbI with pentapeptide repeats